MCGRSKQRVDGGTEAVFARTLGHANGSRHDEQVIVGRRDNDVARTEILAVHRARRGERTGSRQDLMEHAGRLRPGVKHDADRCRKIRRQSGDERFQRVDTARRCADDDNMFRPHTHLYTTLVAKQDVRHGG